MSDVKKCPKCSGEMVRGSRLVSYTEVTLAKEGNYVGDTITPFVCKNCRYIELYREIKK